jgi:tripartite-type tricarboxylate transporter receptor subunit TctC
MYTSSQTQNSMKPYLHLLAAIILPLALAPAQRALAQSYPSKPIRLVVAFSAGGGGDNVVRPLAARLNENLGTPVIVDNRPGGGGIIGAGLAARAAPDGYTLLVTTGATHATAPLLHRSPPYHPMKDFVPITLLVTSPTLIAASNKAGFTSVKALVDAAKANPGKLSYASGGPGSAPHLATELFNSIAGIELLQVPYKGGGESVPALMAGEIDTHFFAVATAMPYLNSGRFRVLAIAAENRWPDLPNVPTFAEAGYPQYRNANWYGLSAPAGTPKAIVSTLNAEVRKVLAAADYRERLRLAGAVPVGNSPQEYSAFLHSEYERYARLIATLGLRSN